MGRAVGKLAGAALAAALAACMAPAVAVADDFMDEPRTAEALAEVVCEASEEIAPGPAVAAEDFMELGVVEYGGREFTWYSEKVLPGCGLDELNANGRTVDASGYVVDADGYIAVASPWGADAIGTVLDTPAKVYDECESGSYDVYTSW